MNFAVRFAEAANDDLRRLLAFLLQRAETPADADLAEQTIAGLRAAASQQLSVTPYSFRKAANSPTRRELIIPFGATGYVALYEIAGPSLVIVLAVRHQREEDYH